MADVLRVEPLARLKLLQNGVVTYQQVYAPAEESYVEHSADRVVLATNMVSPQAVNLGGVTTGRHLMLTTSGTILVGVNSTTILWTVRKALLLEGSFASVYLQNESTTNTATVEVVVTD